MTLLPVLLMSKDLTIVPNIKQYYALKNRFMFRVGVGPSLGLVVTSASCNRESTAKTTNTNVSTRW